MSSTSDSSSRDTALVHVLLSLADGLLKLDHTLRRHIEQSDARLGTIESSLRTIQSSLKVKVQCPARTPEPVFVQPLAKQQPSTAVEDDLTIAIEELQRRLLESQRASRKKRSVPSVSSVDHAQSSTFDISEDSSPPTRSTSSDGSVTHVSQLLSNLKRLQNTPTS